MRGISKLRISVLALLVLLGSFAVRDATAQSVAECLWRKPTVVGTPGNDRLVGTEGEDTFLAGRGDDIVFGLGDHDLICGGEGRDVLIGGEGVDYITGDTGNDKMSGGEGDDTIYGVEGLDALAGDAGEDELNGGVGGDVVTGGPDDDRMEEGARGSDVLKGGSGDDYISDYDDYSHGNDYEEPLQPTIAFADRIRGGPGDDAVWSFIGEDDVAGGSGMDRCVVDRGAAVGSCEDRENWIAWWNTPSPKRYPTHCFGRRPTLIGTPQGDHFDPGPKGEVVVGRGGDDVIHVSWDSSREDYLCGGPGDDSIGSYTWSDAISGGPGDDSLTPGYGDDLIYGGPGNDRVEDWDMGAVSGTDTWFMGPGADTVKVRDGNDVVFGGPGPDSIANPWTCDRTYLHGNGGDDTFDAFADWDSYDGGTCNDPPDYVYGDGGTDKALLNLDDFSYEIEDVERKEDDDEH